MPTSKPSRPTAPDGQWAVLAREYESQLKALCESDDPIGVLADWAAHAGLPEPKVLSKIAAVRSRVEREAEEHKTDAEFWKHNAEERASELATLRSRVAAMEAGETNRIHHLEQALSRLANEVLGILPMMDAFARREFGNTNYALLIRRAEEARAISVPLLPGSAA